jgi:hypothetical protein
MRTIQPSAVFRASILIYLALAVGASMTRAPWWDEGVFGDIAQSFATVGRLASLCLDDDGYVPFPKNHEHIFWQFPAYLVITGFWSKIFGMTILGMRFFSVIVGVGGLFAWRYVLRDTLRDAWLATWIVLLIAVDYGYQVSASNGRMDMLCHATGIGSIALAIWYLDRPSAARALLAGTVFAICLTTHPMALIYCLLFAWHLWIRRSQWSSVRFGHVAIYLVPAILAFGGWAIYAMQDWATFKAQMDGNTSYRVGGPRNPFVVLYTDFRVRYWENLRFPGEVNFLKLPVLGIYLGASLLPLLIPSIRRRHGALTLVVMPALAVISLAYFDNQRFSFYLIHTLPLMLGPVVLTAEWIWRSRTSFARPLAVTFLSGVFAVTATMTLAKITGNAKRHGYDPAVSYMKQVVLPGELIMGGSELGYGLGFTKQFEDDRHLGFFSGRIPHYFAEHKIYYAVMLNRPHAREAREYRERLLREQYEVVFENFMYRVYKHKYNGKRPPG